MMYTGSNTYQQIAVQTSSPTRLVVMLYEGAIRFLRESIAAIEANELERKRQSIDRSVAIVQHLHSTLDMEKGGEVAANLHHLYSYVMSLILEGSAKLETAPVEEAIKLLNVLLAGWEELAKKELAPAVPPQRAAQQAAGGGFELHA
jgi:flagellar protein FliS